IIRRMVLETPPKFLTEALTAAAYNPHAAIIPPESFIRHLFLTAPDELIVKCLEAFARFAPRLMCKFLAGDLAPIGGTPRLLPAGIEPKHLGRCPPAKTPRCASVRSPSWRDSTSLARPERTAVHFVRERASAIASRMRGASRPSRLSCWNATLCPDSPSSSRHRVLSPYRVY